MDKFDQLKVGFEILLCNYPLNQFRWVKLVTPSFKTPYEVFSILEVTKIEIKKDKINLYCGIYSWFDREHCNKEEFNVESCLRQFTIIVRDNSPKNALNQVLERARK